jgi:hypothetical protein
MKSLLWIFISIVLVGVMGFVGKVLGYMFNASAGGMYLLISLFLFVGSIIAGRISRKRAIVGPMIACAIAMLLLADNNDVTTVIILVLAALATGSLGGFIGSRFQKKSAQPGKKASAPPEPEPEVETRFCPSCGEALTYMPKHEAYYCKSCKKYPEI